VRYSGGWWGGGLGGGGGRGGGGGACWLAGLGEVQKAWKNKGDDLRLVSIAGWLHSALYL